MLLPSIYLWLNKNNYHNWVNSLVHRLFYYYSHDSLCMFSLFEALDIAFDLRLFSGIKFDTLSQRSGSRIFIYGGGGGGAKYYVPARTLRSQTELTFSRVILMLSRAIWGLFLKHFDFKINGIKNIVDPIIGGGGGACCILLPWIRHCHRQ